MDDYKSTRSQERNVSDSITIGTKLPQIPEAVKRSKLKMEQSTQVLKNISQRSSKTNRNVIHSYMEDYSVRDGNT